MIAHLEFLEGSGARARRWLIAALLMLSAHAAAGTYALMNWPEEELAEEDAGAFLVELSPVVAAPETEKLNLAIGQRSEEAAPAVAPTEEVKEKSEVETPKVEEAPKAPPPEVVVEKQKPIEEVDEKEEKEDPRPEQKAIPQASVAAQETAAPPPVEAPVAEKPTAPKQGVSSKPSEATMSWHKSLVFHLNKHKKYPHEARKAGEEGTTDVSFTIDRSGKVISTHLDHSSGSELLDKEAIEVLNRASPFPTPPSDVPNLTITLSLPIQFRIKR
jgi:periplasmic protein TonB